MGRKPVGLDDAAMCQLRGNRIGLAIQEPMTALNPQHTVGDQIAGPLRLGIDSLAVSSLSFAKKIRGVSSFIIRVMILGNTACSASVQRDPGPGRRGRFAPQNRPRCSGRGRRMRR